MLFRSSAAICGAVIALAISVTFARSESAIDHSGAVVAVKVHSVAAVDAASGDAIVGAASTYNPFKPGWREGGPNTASGERYDPSVWAAAIKTSLRQKFGGVQFGARPKFALVEAAGKKVIVKINDVGPLTPGRIIDLNERAMRYFDPSLELGVIHDVKVRPLAGDYWITGPAG
jgi:rare lipoprotein A